MKHIKIFVLTAFLSLLAASCTSRGQQSTCYISNDSTALFQFTQDSLLISSVPGGCPVASYALENVSGSMTRAEYIGTDAEGMTHTIVLSMCDRGAHFEREIVIDDEVTPAFKVVGNDAGDGGIGKKGH